MTRLVQNWFKRREPPLDIRWEQETYVPMHVLDLVRRLYPEYAQRGKDPEQFRLFCRLLLSLIHQRYRRQHQHLTRLYSTLDPDRDPLPWESKFPEEEKERHREFIPSLQWNEREATAKLFHDLGDILERANYQRLSPRQIQLTVGAASHLGIRLRVRFSTFRRLEVYARGDIQAVQTRLRWYRFWRSEEVQVPIYQRLVVLFRVREDKVFDEEVDPRCVHIRMFKNIPKFDIDMLLPGTGIRMNWIDHGKIGLPSVWGLGLLLWKIVRNASLLALIGIANAMASVVLAIAVLGALIFFIVKSFFSYTSTKRRYMLDVARSLYFRNLDNNMGALLRLLDEAEQQEACESILAYFMLSKPEHTGPITLRELDRQSEEWLTGVTESSIDFDVEDAVRDLAPLGIISCTGDGWVALPIEEALVKLNTIWDNSFTTEVWPLAVPGEDSRHSTGQSPLL